MHHHFSAETKKWRGVKKQVNEKLTGNCAWIDCNCGGDKTPELARYSSSVLMVPSERLICAGSGMAGCVRACVRASVCVDSTKVQANKGGGVGRKKVNYVEPSVKKKVNNS